MINRTLETAIYLACNQKPQKRRDFTEEEKQYICINAIFCQELLLWFESTSSNGCWTVVNTEFMNSLYPVKENKMYAHANFAWSGRHFFFSAISPSVRSVEINAQSPQLFPDRQRVFIYQSLGKDGNWSHARLKLAQQKLGKEGLINLISLLEIGASIIDDADGFFRSPKNWLEINCRRIFEKTN